MPYQEGQTAVGPNGERAVYQGGQWVSTGAGPSQMPADPTYPYKGPQAAGQVANTEAQTGHANAETVGQTITNQRERATLPFAVPQAQARMLADQAAAQKAQAEAAALASKQQQATQGQQLKDATNSLNSDQVINNIAGAKNDVSWASTGPVGQMLSHLWATPSKNLAADLQNLSANNVLGAIGNLRAESPDGTLGGMRITQNEIMLLKDAVAALDQSQSPEHLKQNLAKVDEHYRRVKAIGAGMNPYDPSVAQAYGLPVPSPQQVVNNVGPDVVNRELQRLKPGIYADYAKSHGGASADPIWPQVVADAQRRYMSNPQLQRFRNDTRGGGAVIRYDQHGNRLP